MQNRYEHRNRRKYNLKVHIVLVTKYRKALLRHGIDDFVKRARLRKGKAAPPTLQEEWVSAATVNYEKSEIKKEDHSTCFARSHPSDDRRMVGILRKDVQ